ncbi:MAG: adenylate/guanylate cyclase domain-containing protein, partial [Alphaproteobacteria bacterium]
GGAYGTASPDAGAGMYGESADYGGGYGDAYGAGASGIAMPGPAAGAAAARLRGQVFAVLVALLIALVGLRLGRGVAERRRPRARVAYGHVGRGVSAALGSTILEVSRGNAIPHAAVCGGRGRCSTCRVRVSGGAAALSQVQEDEQRVLARIGAPKNVRLACQARLLGDVEVTPLLPAASGPDAAGARPDYAQGREQEIAVLFADLRGFTRLAETKLPYDVVFILNRYFAAMGRAVEAADGRLDKFIGDGVMALFGIERGVEDGCARALAAAVEMGRRLDDLNAALAHDLAEPLRIGIGIHAGPAIVGEMGYGDAVAITAIGDTVNVASRLEAASKELAAELVISAEVAVRAGIDASGLAHHEIDIRGRREPLAVHAVERAQAIKNLLPPETTIVRR